MDLLLLIDECRDFEFDEFRELGGWISSWLDSTSLSHASADEIDARHEGFKAGCGRFRGRCVPIPAARPSLGLVDIATVAAANGYSVHILDNYIRYPGRRAQVARALASDPPRVIGLSTTFILNPKQILREVRWLRECAPEAFIVIGGPTVRNDDALHVCADAAVFGPGERAMLAILDAVVARKRALADIPNLSLRGSDGRPHYTKNARSTGLVGITGRPYRQLPDDEIPIPDWSLYPDRLRTEVYPIEFSRGCKYNCAYCGYERGKVIRPLAAIRRELIANAALGITHYRIVDATFTDGPPGYPEYPKDILRLMIELDLGLRFTAFARADDIDDEIAALLKRAGCTGLFLGLESGDDRILELMHKGHGVQAARDALATCRRHGIFTHANFIVGYPGETLESVANTNEFVLGARPDMATMSVWFMADRAPVSAPKVKRRFDIRGSELAWSHATMDSQTACRLVRETLTSWSSHGVVIGSEYSLLFFESIVGTEQAWKLVEAQGKLMASLPGGARQQGMRELREAYRADGPIVRYLLSSMEAMGITRPRAPRRLEALGRP